MVHFIGAGPGAEDLITVRGAKLLGEADVIIYAGSLVNPALLSYKKESCAVYDSASMTLEQVIEVMKDTEARGGMTVRLHTGDPSLYGAIREQMDELDKLGIGYDVTPGVSSFSGAAAALCAEYTLPEVSQSVIITRMAGRTPVPEGEELRKMASHGCTMVLFLSTGLLEDVEQELAAGGYAPDTPAAIGYKATWPEQRVYRCTVSTLARTARENRVTKTALITIGHFLGDDYERSKLYDPTFTHEFRADALVFVGAAGIAVRAIAPHVRDKFSDPAVVSVDEAGRFVVPLLSGHVGGANELARRVAALTGGQAAVSTATDVNGLFAVDVWARERGMAITDRVLAKEVSAALLEGRPVGFASDFGHPCPEGLTAGPAELGVWITDRTGEGPFPRTLRLVPRSLILGIGCRRGTPEAAIAAAADAALAGLAPEAVAGVATIDLKKDESGLLAFCARRGLPLTTYSAEALAAVEGDFTPSAFVRGITGVDNVCERAAAAAGGRIIVPKQANNGVTAAVARKDML